MMHENAGVRNFVIELSPTRAYFMERYFTKEDSVAKMYLMASSSKHYMNLFDSIAIWNRALPASEKIKVHGLDVERFYDMSVLWLYDILKRRVAASGAGGGRLPRSKCGQYDPHRWDFQFLRR